MRTGPLSDEYILKHCAIYRPIPLGPAQSILMHDLHRETSNVNAITGKALKYQKPIPRPTSFDALAKTLTKMSGNPQTYDHLKNLYADEIRNFKSTPPKLILPSPPNVGPASLMPQANRIPPSVQSDVSDVSSRADSPTNTETTNGNGNGNDNGDSSSGDADIRNSFASDASDVRRMLAGEGDDPDEQSRGTYSGSEDDVNLVSPVAMGDDPGDYVDVPIRRGTQPPPPPPDDDLERRASDLFGEMDSRSARLERRQARRHLPGSPSPNLRRSYAMSRPGSRVISNPEEYRQLTGPETQTNEELVTEIQQQMAMSALRSDIINTHNASDPRSPKFV